jgi:uncharacterized membrane protein YkgB
VKVFEHKLRFLNREEYQDSTKFLKAIFIQILGISLAIVSYLEYEPRLVMPIILASYAVSFILV